MKTDEIRLRLEEIRQAKQGRVRWQISHHTAELAISENAVLLAKSRVLRRLRQEAVGLLD